MPTQPYPLHHLWIQMLLNNTPDYLRQTPREHTVGLVLKDGLQVILDDQVIPIPPLALDNTFFYQYANRRPEKAPPAAYRIPEPLLKPLPDALPTAHYPRLDAPSVAYNVEYHEDTNLVVAHTPVAPVLSDFNRALSQQYGMPIQLQETETIPLATIYRMPPLDCRLYDRFTPAMPLNEAVALLLESYWRYNINPNSFLTLFPATIAVSPTELMPHRVPPQDFQNQGRRLPIPEPEEFPPEDIITEEPDNPPPTDGRPIPAIFRVPRRAILPGRELESAQYTALNRLLKWLLLGAGGIGIIEAARAANAIMFLVCLGLILAAALGLWFREKPAQH